MTDKDRDDVIFKQTTHVTAVIVSKTAFTK
jgi:hypothetical protein